MKQGKVVGINGNMVTVALDSSVIMNEVGYIITAEGTRLKSEVIRVMGDEAQLQVFEITKGISIDNVCEFSGDMLAVQLGPGLFGTGL
jgi:V/A-type H+-transporting ATPase subunit A